MRIEEKANKHVRREPPYSVEYEQALLAACMIEGGQESLSACLELKLNADSFYLPSHAEVFNACLELYKDGSPVSELTVGEKLKALGKLERVGGYIYLNEIVDRIETPAYINYYAKKVKELELSRRMVQFFLSELENAYTNIDDIEGYLGGVEQKVLEISEDRISDNAKLIQGPVDKAIDTVQKLLQAKGSVSGVSTGFKDLDAITFGLHPAEMIVLAARPSMGKTALALNVAEAAVLNFKNTDDIVPTLMFSLEMSSEQLALRLLCSRARINMNKLREGFLSKEDYKVLSKTATDLKRSPLFIDEAASITILEMRAKARRMNSKHKLGLVIVDYLQLISGTDNRMPREQQIAEISRGLKAMAKELNVPVLVLSQLNRESEKERRQPRLSDLRESGSIEQDADLVLLLSKHHGDDPDVVTGSHVARDLIVAKQRNGPVGTVPLTFIRPFTRFENYIQQDEN